MGLRVHDDDDDFKSTNFLEWQSVIASMGKSEYVNLVIELIKNSQSCAWSFVKWYLKRI